MDIQVERNNLIKRLKNINDESLLKALKSLLDYAQKYEDQELEESIDRALDQSLKKEGRPHKEVMAEIRAKFQG